MTHVTGQELADNAAGLIHDVDRIRWSDPDWLQWINDGQREAVVAKPEVNVLSQSVTLTPDVTRQLIPSEGIQFFGLTRNMGADGMTPGKAIRVVSREVMDAAVPDWHTEDSPGEITNYMFDPRDPMHFYVYPKAPATPWRVELVYAAVPTQLATLDDHITISDIYANALLNYMLYRAHSRDSIYSGQNQMAQSHYQIFMAALGVKTVADATRSPNLTTAEFSPEAPAAAAKPAG